MLDVGLNCDWLESGGGSECKKLSLLDSYNLSEEVIQIIASGAGTLNIPIDCTTPLRRVEYQKDAELTLEPNTIVYPVQPLTSSPSL